MTKSIDTMLEEILNEHLMYELNQLEDSLYIVRCCPIWFITNAAIESWCVHARSLDDFFRNIRSKSDDVTAEEVTSPTYTARFVTKIDRNLRIKINKQIAHITRGRTRESADRVTDRDMERATPLFLNEAEAFGKQIKPEYAPAWKWQRRAPRPTISMIGGVTIL